MAEYLPVRRSKRRNKSNIDREKREIIEAKLLLTNDSELDLEIHEFKNKGRGIIAKRNFGKGDFVCEYSGRTYFSIKLNLKSFHPKSLS